MASRNRRGKEKYWTANSSESEDSETTKKSFKNNKFHKKSSRKRKNETQSDESSSSDSDESIRKKKAFKKKEENSFNFKKRPFKLNTDSSSGKEFQKPFRKKMRSFRVDEANYTAVHTPSRSDDEDLPVEEELEKSLKKYVSEEVKKIKKISSDLDSDLNLFEEYTKNKKIDYTHKSKFLPHKVLKIYEEYFHKVKTSRDKFIELYSLWLDDCKLSAKNTSVNNISKKSFKIYSDDSENENEIKKKKSVNISRKSTKSLKDQLDTSESLDEKINNDRNSSFHKRAKKDFDVESKSSDVSENDRGIKNNKNLSLTCSKNAKKSTKQLTSDSEDDEVNCDKNSSMRKKSKSYNVKTPELKNKSIQQISSKEKSKKQISKLNSSSSDEHIQMEKSPDKSRIQNTFENKNISIENNSQKSDDEKISTKEKSKNRNSKLCSSSSDEDIQVDKSPNKSSIQNTSEDKIISIENHSPKSGDSKITEINSDKENSEISDVDINIEDDEKNSSTISNSQKNISSKNQEKNIPVSDCDSEEIFSADELNDLSKNLRSDSKNSTQEDNVLSPEEIENSPIRSPELKSRSLRKTLLLTSFAHLKNVHNQTSHNNKIIDSNNIIEIEKTQNLEKIDENTLIDVEKNTQDENLTSNENNESEIKINKDVNIQVPIIKISESNRKEILVTLNGKTNSNEQTKDSNVLEKEKNRYEQEKIENKEDKKNSKKNNTINTSNLEEDSVDEIDTVKGKAKRKDEEKDLTKNFEKESDKKVEKQKNDNYSKKEENMKKKISTLNSEESHEENDEINDENEIKKSSSKNSTINFKNKSVNKEKKGDGKNKINLEETSPEMTILSDDEIVLEKSSLDLKKNAKKELVKKKESNKMNDEKEKNESKNKQKINNKSGTEGSSKETNDEEEKIALDKLLQDWDSDTSAEYQSIDSKCSTILLGEHPKKNRRLKKSLNSSRNKVNNLSSSSSSEDEMIKPALRRRKKIFSVEEENSDAETRTYCNSINLENNKYYKNDKKLQMECQVHITRLSKGVLKKHAKALEKSKEYIENKKFNSIINLDTLESTKKSKKNSHKKNKKSKNKNSTIEDYSSMDVDNNLSDNNGIDNSPKDLSDDLEIPDDENMINEIEKNAKEALLDSNSSNDESVLLDDELSVEEKTSKSKKKRDKNRSSKTENKEKKSWKQDKLLHFNISNSDSEEGKQNNSENDKNDDSCEIINDSPIKKKRNAKKPRILNSDSDGEFVVSGLSDSNASAKSEKQTNEKKKKRKKRDRSKSSDSESSLDAERPKLNKRKRIKKVDTDSEDDDKASPDKKGRKNIRRVMKDKQVADDTKQAAKDEEERLKRIAERQKIFNEMHESRLAGEEKVEKLVLDINEETKEELIVVDPELVKRLKPHQAQGIKFMWDACFESLKQMETSKGSGCIIAHCMGLGKTFQVITLIHTLLSHEETGVKTVMIVCPLSTVLNWCNEFKIWLKYVKNEDEIDVYELTKTKKNCERKYQLETWHKHGGVLVIGYEMFRNLTSTGKKMRKAMQESIRKCLVDPGADLVVCDEGHLLKNEDSALSKAMKLVNTSRRIVLTGTPLQNNLKEYHCMVQFVKPNLLGTKKEFLNRFVNPITNGQLIDSTDYDVKLMKKRAHVLHKMLEGSVQRFDYSVLTPFLPPKQEYVIFVRLTDIQIKMYQYYLENLSRRIRTGNGALFADFQELQRIWTHPFVLRLNQEKVEKANEKKRLENSDSEGSLKDFIDDGSDSEASSSSDNSDVQCLDSDNELQAKRSTRANPIEPEIKIEESDDKVEEVQWWSQFVEEDTFRDMRVSSKLLLLFGILRESEQIGDKVLVFSQSLYSLTLIEEFLNLIDQESQSGSDSELLAHHRGNWTLGADYFRLDGSTSPENRSAWCKIFNNPNNTRARLFLISTRAGGLGINLTAANRVIIFDASWNPSHDVQSIFRIYRFGQKKPCYVYRFLAAGTMEEKIYNRQVTKLSLACRVVDEQQIERHYNNNDLAELYQFEPNTDKTITLNLPKDRLLAELFLKYKDNVYNYHEHDSLLENKAEEELDEEERKQAWKEYEEEKLDKRPQINYGLGYNQYMFPQPSFPELQSIRELIQKDYPNLPPEHLDVVARQAVYDMYRYVDQQATINPFNVFNRQIQPTVQNQMASLDPLRNYLNQQQNQQQPQQPTMNYVQTMPTYSGRGRPPKIISGKSMQTPIIGGMANPMMGTSMNQTIPLESVMVTGTPQGYISNNGEEE